MSRAEDGRVTLTLSAVQYEALDRGIAANLAEHIRLIEDADDHGSRLVVFPELSLTGYALPRLSEPDQWLAAAHPAYADAAAEEGADIYAVSALYTAAEGRRLDLHLGTRAMDHRMYSVLANLGGTTPLGPSAGKSGFWGPDGFVLRQAAGTGTEVLTATLPHRAARI